MRKGKYLNEDQKEHETKRNPNQEAPVMSRDYGVLSIAVALDLSLVDSRLSIKPFEPGLITRNNSS
jgi:hypothetical protein